MIPLSQKGAAGGVAGYDDVIFKASNYVGSPKSIKYGIVSPGDIFYNSSYGQFYAVPGIVDSGTYIRRYDINANPLTGDAYTGSNYLAAGAYNSVDGYAYYTRNFSSYFYVVRVKDNSDGTVNAAMESKASQIPGTWSNIRCITFWGTTVFYVIDSVTKILYLYSWADVTSPSVATLSFITGAPISMTKRQCLFIYIG